MLLLVDGNGLQWRSYYSRGLEDEGITKGIYNYIFSFLYRFKPEGLLVFWDVSKSKWRKEFYSNYKAARERKQKEEIDLEEVYRQVDVARSNIEKIGIRNIYVKGVEADDLISWFSEYYHGYLGQRVVIASGDGDLWQLINGSVSVYDHVRNDMIKVEDVLDRMNIPPEMIYQYKSIVGDASDGIAGVKGIGKKTALSLFEKYGDLSKIIKVDNIEELSKKKATEKLLNSIGDIKLAYKLVKSPCFYDSRWFLTDDNFKQLEECVMKPIQKDINFLNIIHDDVNDYSRRGFNYLPNKVDNCSEMLQYMRPIHNELSTYHSFFNDIDSCNNCSLCLSKRRSNPEIGINSKFMFVLDREADEESLEFLDSFLERVGLTYSDIWLTYVNKCHVGFFPATYGQLRACERFLKSELNILKPKIVVTFGSDSMVSLTELRGKSVDHVGSMVKLDEKYFGGVNCNVFVMNDLFNISFSKKEKVNFDYGCDRFVEILEKYKEGGFDE